MRLSTSINVFIAVLLNTSEKTCGFQPSFPADRGISAVRVKNGDVFSQTSTSSCILRLESSRRDDGDYCTNTNTKEMRSNPLPKMVGHWLTMILACLTIASSTVMGTPFVASAAEGTMASAESSLLQSTPKNADTNVVNEVWALINKYYINQSFNGQVN
jgi:hypothetical protein